MDVDIGNILYIVITLVVVIIGLLGKKKKPGTGDSGAAEAPRRPDFLENLSRVLQMDQEPMEVRDLKDYEEDLPSEETAASNSVGGASASLNTRGRLMDDYDRLMKQGQEEELSMEGEDGLTPGALEVIELEELEGTNYFEIIKDFDAGTAVVYSAIINRLDY